MAALTSVCLRPSNRRTRNGRDRTRGGGRRGRAREGGGRVIEGEVNVSCLLRSSLPSSALRFV